MFQYTICPKFSLKAALGCGFAALRKREILGVASIYFLAALVIGTLLGIMSGAGALSCVLALREALDIPVSLFETAYHAHLAEIKNSTGLGDVVAQCTGGVTMRKRQGIPPHGFVDNIATGQKNVVCLTLPEPTLTARSLTPLFSVP